MRHTDFGTVPCCHAVVRQTRICTIQNFLLAIKKEPPSLLSKKFGSQMALILLFHLILLASIYIENFACFTFFHLASVNIKIFQSPLTLGCYSKYEQRYPYRDIESSCEHFLLLLCICFRPE